MDRGDEGLAAFDDDEGSDESAVVTGDVYSPVGIININ